MAFFKPLVCVALALVVWWAWPQRAWLSDPYFEEREPVTLMFEGFSELEQTEIEPSAMSVAWLGADAVNGGWSGSPVEAQAPEVELGGGDVTISGTVRGLGLESGLAVVVLERVAAGGTASATFLAGEDGQYQATGLLGGAYRIRAYVPGELASAGAQVAFVPAGSDVTADLAVSRPSDYRRVEVAQPQLWVDGRTTFSFVVGQESVDDQGRLTVAPVGGLVMRVSVLGADLLSADTVVTNQQGSGSVTVTCPSTGPVTLVLDNVAFTHRTSLGRCAVPPPPPEPEPAPGLETLEPGAESSLGQPTAPASSATNEVDQ